MAAEAKAQDSSQIDDAFDFTDYEAAIGTVQDQLRSDLARIKAGGRDLESVEQIRVNSGKKSSPSSQKGTAIGDLASVMQRGRNIVVMVAEKDYLKSITSALNSIPDMTPHPPPAGGEPLHIILPIPPVTHESRLQASKTAHERGEKALFALRDARTAQKKRLRALGLARKVTPDKNHRAEQKMEKVNEKANTEVKRVIEEARKRLEGGGGRG
ncbi:uncharacterized protein KY384_008505 [Bacidia gigantensis]|uniref:uncharacterized protein n=1 Tax=Bacidia gigantensis TaxID=2732470 RepID=UPI001D0521AB|nr:uncharacterized protein KY384_008505 [Bacidia gigantensis]KAG8527076.1 hypothetical protein KY384_008505 [Bacidia gigantensis]